MRAAGASRCEVLPLTLHSAPSQLLKLLKLLTWPIGSVSFTRTHDRRGLGWNLAQRCSQLESARVSTRSELLELSLMMSSFFEGSSAER